METFTIPYKNAYQYTAEWNTTITPTSSGKEQRAANWDSPRRGWTVEFAKDVATIDQVREFFNARKGRYEAFNWIPPEEPSSVKVRFDVDKFSAAIEYGYGTFTIPFLEVL